MSDAIMRAAEARAGACRAAADRPQKRRAGEAVGSTSAAITRARPTLAIRSKDGAGDNIEFTGYASVTDTPYEMWDMFGPYNEVVAGSAFDESLARTDLDVPLVIGHNDNQRIARTTIPDGPGSLNLSTDDTGLLCRALLDPNDTDVAAIVPKMRSGLVDEMSFKFRIDAGRWSEDFTTFAITNADIHRGDVSIVGYGANPNTSLNVRHAVSLEEYLADEDNARRTLADLQARFAPTISTGMLARLDAAIARQYRTAL